MASTLQHPCHDKHALILGELSDNCSFPCNLCKLDFNGPAYCCWECDIFLHKSCAELPLKVKFSGHSEHPNLKFDFDGKNYLYTCDDCYFYVKMASVVLDLNNSKEAAEEEDKELIQHFCHEHPLASFNLNTPIRADCTICKRQIFGPLYGCTTCDLLLHESCARLPKEIEQHPLHPHHNLTLHCNEDYFKCSACNASSHNWPYGYDVQCDDCEFRLDVRCASSTMPSEKQQEDCIRSIEHFSHEHSLSSFSMKKTDICCNGCGDKLQGEVYGCPGCGFFMHKSCVEEFPQEIIHSLHPDHPLVLRQKPRCDGGGFRCDSCRINSCGSFFTCEICQFDLDPVCALQTLAAVKEGAAAEITHFSHDHQLALCYGSPGGKKSSHDDPDHCVLCGGLFKGLVYCCQSCDRLMIHKHCAELPWKLEHPLHPHHPLTLEPSRDSHCVASRLTTEGPTYCCEGCQFFLSAKAAVLNPTLKHQPHEHDLTYFDKCDRDPCNYCGNRCNVDSYLCVLCNFNVHYSCIRRLPLSIKHDCHIDPLVLCDKYVIPHLEEQYCDACETTRRQDRAVYFCEECKFAAHIGCVIPWVQIEGTDLDGLNRQIEILEAKVDETKRNLEAYMEELMGLEAKRKALLCREDKD